jgi:putative hydrolases of HD superfamily
MNGRLQDQIKFLIEIDKVKHIFRRTKLLDASRYENDAEHAWHLAMMAMVLQEYSNEKVDLTRVLKMVLIHDLVEIDAGDFFLYDEAAAKQKEEAEAKAAERVFGLLPEDQGREFKELWEEFEQKRTPEARFAAALDRMEPLMQNALTEGCTWKKHGVKKDLVIAKNKPVVAGGSKELWTFIEGILEESARKGYFPE